jgi:hypothetical protein
MPIPASIRKVERNAPERHALSNVPDGSMSEAAFPAAGFRPWKYSPKSIL